MVWGGGGGGVGGGGGGMDREGGLGFTGTMHIGAQSILKHAIPAQRQSGNMSSPGSAYLSQWPYMLWQWLVDVCSEAAGCCVQVGCHKSPLST